MYWTSRQGLSLTVSVPPVVPVPLQDMPQKYGGASAATVPLFKEDLTALMTVGISESAASV